MFFTPLRFISGVPLFLGGYVMLFPTRLIQYVTGPTTCPPGAMCERLPILPIIMSLFGTILVLYVFACFLVEKPLSKRMS